MNTLEVDSIYKTVNPGFTVSDIYLKCKTGNIIGIFGRNGSGKSVLMEVIFGTCNAEYKAIRVNGTSYLKPYQHHGLLNYLPQHTFLPKELRVIQAVRPYLNKQHLAEFIKDSLIKKLYHHKIKILSGSEVRYIEIKLLLLYPCTLLDEPFSQLSPLLGDKVLDMMIVATKIKGIIVTDHNFERLESIDTSMYLMQNGSIRKINGRNQLIAFNYLPK